MFIITFDLSRSLIIPPPPQQQIWDLNSRSRSIQSVRLSGYDIMNVLMLCTCIPTSGMCCCIYFVYLFFVYLFCIFLYLFCVSLFVISYCISFCVSLFCVSLCVYLFSYLFLCISFCDSFFLPMFFLLAYGVVSVHIEIKGGVLRGCRRVYVCACVERVNLSTAATHTIYI